MPPKKLNKNYQVLQNDLKKILQQGQWQALGTLQKIRIQTYWNLGKRLGKSKDITDIHLRQEWFQKLGEELNFDRSNLYRALQFYQTYPKGLPKIHETKPLSWRSHLALLPLQNQKERQFYLKQAIDKNWSEKKLRQAMAQNLYQATLLPEAKKSKRKTKTKLERPQAGLYLYTAVVERVIDGDTLLVRIDLGFNVWKSQRLRLRAIDTPELKTPEGQTAKAALIKILEAVEFVVLKTYRMDLHGRFVADIFYLIGEEDQDIIFQKGVFLNRQLVELGHAVVVG